MGLNRISGHAVPMLASANLRESENRAGQTENLEGRRRSLANIEMINEMQEVILLDITRCKDGSPCAGECRSNTRLVCWNHYGKLGLLFPHTSREHWLNDLQAVFPLLLASWLAAMESTTCVRHVVHRQGHHDTDGAHPESIPVLFRRESRCLCHLHG